MSTNPLRFLADESCDFSVVRILRADGHDVLAISEIMQQSEDRVLIETAYREQRILLTEDKDFGWLVFVSHHDCPGVLFIRFPSKQRTILPETIARLVRERRDLLLGAFIVIQPGHIRISNKRP